MVLALGSGAAWSGAWETILLFVNGEPWGEVDPTLGRDIGFYIFDLPFWRFLLGWASTTLIIVGLLTLGAYAARAVHWQFHLSAPVRAHLSVIGALLLVVSPPATSSTSPSWRTRRVAGMATSRRRCTPT